MTFESMQVIYSLLERETEDLERAWKEARKAVKAAVEDGRPEDIVSALESDEAAASKEYISILFG